MEKNANTTQVALKSGEESSLNKPFTVDAYADRLMDDLFGDVDRILDGGNSHLPASTPPEYVSLKTIAIPHLVLPQVIVPVPEVKPPSLEPQLETITVAKAEKQRKTEQFFDQLLLGTAFASLVIILGLWLGSRTGLDQIWTAIAPIQFKLSPESEADAQFSQYMQRSLEIIDQKVPDSKNPNGMLATSGTNLGPLPTSLGNSADTNSLAQALNRLSIVLDRFNPPFAQINTKSVSALPKPPLPPLPVQKAVVVAASKPQSKVNQVSSTPSPRKEASSTPSPVSLAGQPPSFTLTPPPIPSTIAPSTPNNPETTPTPTPAVTSTPTAPTTPTETPTPTPTSTETPSPTPTETPSPTPTHNLVGILELGERSAALFEINGVARRVNIGESIGSSGWTLVKIGKGEAVIRRSGEVRSIYVGQGI